MEPTHAVLDRFEDSGDILSAIKRAFHDATHDIMANRGAAPTAGPCA